jgi:hypothetical protein
VVLMALPGARIRCEPPLSMKPRVSVPEIVSVPPDKREPLPDPPLLIVRKPPELTIVALATPAESTNIEPPLTTTSPESVPPDETLYGEFPWLTTVMGPQLFLSFSTVRLT